MVFYRLELVQVWARRDELIGRVPGDLRSDPCEDVDSLSLAQEIADENDDLTCGIEPEPDTELAALHTVTSKSPRTNLAVARGMPRRSRLDRGSLIRYRDKGK